MSRRKQNVVPVVPSAVPGGNAEADREARDREIFQAFMESSGLFAEVLQRMKDEASRPEANEPYFHSQIPEEMAAQRRYRKQIQTIIGHLQGLKKLTDERLKTLREIQDLFRTHGR